MHRRKRFSFRPLKHRAGVGGIDPSGISCLLISHMPTTHISHITYTHIRIQMCLCANVKYITNKWAPIVLYNGVTGGLGVYHENVSCLMPKLPAAIPAGPRGQPRCWAAHGPPVPGGDVPAGLHALRHRVGQRWPPPPLDASPPPTPTPPAENASLLGA